MPPGLTIIVITSIAAGHPGASVVGDGPAAAGETRPISFPTQDQSVVVSPTAPASVPQDHLEPVLLNHLRSLGAPQGRGKVRDVG